MFDWRAVCSSNVYFLSDEKFVALKIIKQNKNTASNKNTRIDCRNENNEQNSGEAGQKRQGGLHRRHHHITFRQHLLPLSSSLNKG